ncbi:MAG: FecR domain-containing protein [Polyangiaceae bacterium]|nr:FecR domain-containing protein [Polyangiaceae bacterium]
MADVNKLCAAVDEAMADVLEGVAEGELYDHIADCDRCRDARHDAERSRELLREAGGDFVLPADLEARLESALAARPGDTVVASAPAPVATKTVAAVTEVPVSQPSSRFAAPRAFDTNGHLVHAESAVGASRPERTLAVAGKPGRTSAAEPARAGAGDDKVVSVARWLRRPRNTIITGVVSAGLAAALVGLLARPASGPGEEPQASEDGWAGKVALVSRAAPGEGGLEVCAADGSACHAVGKGDLIDRGSRLRTDGLTRAHVELDDGTKLALDRATELSLVAGQTRHASLASGTIVAEVAESETAGARFLVPTGSVEVLGTKFALRATERWASVDVSRGTVRLVDAEKRAVSVRAGEEGRLYAGMAPYAASSPALGEALSWSEASQEELGEVRGLGELVAKKPGTDEERTGAVRLASHKVKVRIVDGFARTEIDETFSNSASDVLEGIYRFPIPPDAQIERLALEVDGKFEEGAFVDRDRAAAIWRGAIVNATSRRPPPREEIIWVPGPWRDPALLEWQRGGRFELRVYPIPAKGSRRVVLAYTQALAPSGGARRYVYPLPHDPSGTTRVDDFGLDVQVRGYDASIGVTAQGYDLTRDEREAGTTRLAMQARQFVPAGDLVLEYALPDRNAEVTAWAFDPTGEEPSEPPKAGEPAKTTPAAKPGDAGKAARRLDATSPYAAITVRPRLPEAGDDEHRDFVIVVDSSRSMVGERYKRATALAGRLVEELDRLDRFNVLACDTSCRTFSTGMQAPGHQVAREVQTFLDAESPEGGSDLGLAMRQAAGLWSRRDGRALRVIYLGDGTPTVGAIRPAYITETVQGTLPVDRASVTAVAIGADADGDSLAALARGGGGVVLPYVPGQRTAEAVYAILGASYGIGLRDARVELPSGLTAMAPTKLDTIAAGGEALIVARMSSPHVKGNVKLTGRVAGQPFEASYPLELEATKAKGNAFLPRLYAAERIGELERDTGAEARETAVALSQQFNVASRYTSLLVLESAAMFKAFGLDNERTAPTWTGEEKTERVQGGGDKDKAGDGEGRTASRGKGNTMDLGFGGAGEKSEAEGPMGMPDDVTMPAAGAASPAPTATMPPPMAAPPATSMAKSAPAKKPVIAAEPDEPMRARRPPNMVPMRKVWDRTGSVVTNRLIPTKASVDAIAEGERAVEANGDRREAVRSLFSLYAMAGDVDGAGRAAERWSSRDALDPDALVARADVAARKGERDRAVRILSGVVDARPGDAVAYRRLAELSRFAGNAEQSCRYLVALAQLRERDGEALGQAVRCGRQTSESKMVEDMLIAADGDTRRKAQTELDRAQPAAAAQSALVGDLTVEATWQGQSADLDIGIVGPKGQRVSWLGGLTNPNQRLVVVDATSTGHEGLAFRLPDAGEHVIEIVRASGEGTVHGSLVVNAAGTRQVVPFVLERDRVTVALATLGWKSRLVPAWDAVR